MLGDIYGDAKQAYIKGDIHSLVAMARLASDRTFIAEAELAHGPGNVHACAQAVVLHKWRALLVKAMA